MFWIYGGSLQFGSAGQPTYDGSAFAAYEDVIVVTTNYRTNGETLPRRCCYTIFLIEPQSLVSLAHRSCL